MPIWNLRNLRQTSKPCLQSGDTIPGKPSKRGLANEVGEIGSAVELSTGNVKSQPQSTWIQEVKELKYEGVPFSYLGKLRHHAGITRSSSHYMEQVSEPRPQHSRTVLRSLR